MDVRILRVAIYDTIGSFTVTLPNIQMPKERDKSANYFVAGWRWGVEWGAIGRSMHGGPINFIVSAVFPSKSPQA